VAVPSRSHPRLVSGLAAQLATVGRLPVLDVLATTGPAPQADVAASLRARQVEASIGLAPGAHVEGTVLLVDDFLRTGWTMTVAGALLRRAGADVVLPVVVHQWP
jgi:ATP-dependent DNA helicase RecQ